MAKDAIEVPYNRDLKSLEGLLARAQRPGDFFVQSAIEAPMPRVEVDGVGILSFPVTAGQAAELIKSATRAPYGRGEETILDESVRKVWQIPAERVSLGGKSWEATFRQILDRTVAGLGCGKAKVTADLYKLLVYEEGGFFKAHRDTEKQDGMFGTLVVVLPAPHSGGELVVRHAGREARIDLAGEEFSELRIAAFYADCQHEVLPIRGGHRVCLVFNLCQAAPEPGLPRLTAPLYDAEAAGVAEQLRKVFSGSTPAKLAWLLEHQYSPAGLSLAALKGEDAARAMVLSRAAAQAGCALHLAIVHISESGWAEHSYDPYFRRRSRWRDDDEPAGREDPSEFAVGEVCDGSREIDQWRDSEDGPVDYGPLPLVDGELLPAGGLDGERPDEQRFTEATGNEGASFERAYHRAVLVVWPRAKFSRILLQSSIGAALAHLGRVAAAPALLPAERESIVQDLADVIEAWDSTGYFRGHPRTGQKSDRAEMLEILNRIREKPLLKQFISNVVTPEFDGAEIGPLAASLVLLGPEVTSRLLAPVAHAHASLRPNSCVELLAEIIGKLGEGRNAAWDKALGNAAAEIVSTLPTLNSVAQADARPTWNVGPNVTPLNSASVASLFDVLRAIHAESLRAAASLAIAGNLRNFDACQVVVPALKRLHSARSWPIEKDPDALNLWKAAAEFLLGRSERPPAPPSDWRQEISLACKCAECRDLTAFAKNPAEQIHRFCLRQDRRSHLENQIQQNRIDMACETDRRGRPQTLVCTKTQGAFQRQCAQHGMDVAAMRVLIKLCPAPAAKGLAALAARMEIAASQTPDT